MTNQANADDTLQSPFGQAVNVQNEANACRLRRVRGLSANAFAGVIESCLAALPMERADRLIELTTLGFLVAVTAIRLLTTFAHRLWS